MDIFIYIFLFCLHEIEVYHDSIRHYSSLLEHRIRAAKRVKTLGLIIGMGFLYYLTRDLYHVLFYTALRTLTFDVQYTLLVHKKWLGWKHFFENQEVVKQIKDIFG